jgi:sugar/nucleoside kinase (ribokinase family)
MGYDGSVLRRSFDVICAGEASFPLGPRLRPRGGAINAALALAHRGVRVAIATSLEDDAFGRALEARLAAAKIGVALVRASRLLLTGTSRIVLSGSEDDPFEIPDAWTSPVLLLSGVSPSVVHSAAMCRAARTARRRHTLVVLDVNARWHRWFGREPRSMRALLREADVVRCSPEDLAVLGDDATTLRSLVRRDAVTLITNNAGVVTAMGTFGQVTRAPERTLALRPRGAGDAFTASICADLVRPRERTEAFWAQALIDAQTAAAKCCW